MNNFATFITQAFDAANYGQSQVTQTTNNLFSTLQNTGTLEPTDLMQLQKAMTTMVGLYTTLSNVIKQYGDLTRQVATNIGQ